MFQALKICHEGNYKAFALFIDEGLKGYHIVDAKGASFPNFSDSDGSNPDISTLPSLKGKSLDAARNPESHFHKSAKGPIQV
jgi:hypothetical protein